MGLKHQAGAQHSQALVATGSLTRDATASGTAALPVPCLLPEQGMSCREVPGLAGGMTAASSKLASRWRVKKADTDMELGLLTERSCPSSQERGKELFSYISGTVWQHGREVTQPRALLTHTQAGTKGAEVVLMKDF